MFTGFPLINVLSKSGEASPCWSIPQRSVKIEPGHGPAANATWDSILSLHQAQGLSCQCVVPPTVRVHCFWHVLATTSGVKRVFPMDSLHFFNQGIQISWIHVGQICFSFVPAWCGWEGEETLQEPKDLGKPFLCRFLVKHCRRDCYLVKALHCWPDKFLQDVTL